MNELLQDIEKSQLPGTYDICFLKLLCVGGVQTINTQLALSYFLILIRILKLSFLFFYSL